MKQLKQLKIWAVSVLILMAGLVTTQAWQTSGRVVCEVNGNGQIDANDLPLPNLLVVVTNLSGTFSASAHTGPNGSFVITLPATPDTYIETLSGATLPAGSTLLIPGAGFYQFTLTANQQTFTGDFLINNVACQQGACWLTGGGTIDGLGGKPVHSFGGNVFPGCSPTAGDGGSWTHIAHELNLHFHGTVVNTVSCGNVAGIPPGSRSPVTPFNFIEFMGTGTLKGVGGNKVEFGTVFFFGRAEDRSEPGGGVDRYFLNVYKDSSDPVGSSVFVVDIDGNPATVDPIPTRSGNLQIHISSCD